MEYHVPDARTHQAMLLIAGGLFPFQTNPVLHLSREVRGASGFWHRDAQGQIKKVSGTDWARKFLTRKAAAKKEMQRGGRIIIGLSGINSPENLARIEAYVPDLITEVLAGELRETGWTIGLFGYGRFVAKDGTVYDERSTVVQIAGITTKELKKIALSLAEYLNQTAVLVFDDNTNKTFLVGPDKSRLRGSGPSGTNAEPSREFLSGAQSGQAPPPEPRR